MQVRRTKIIATLGPATDEPEMLERIIAAGVDVVRLNFSHGTEESHAQRAKQVRKIASANKRPVGVLADLQGPKIRIECFKDGPIELAEGAEFTLDAGLASDVGTIDSVGIAYKELPKDTKPGDTLLLDDGRIVFNIDRIEGKKVICKVVMGGTLSDRKGINRQGGGLSASALTDKDRSDIKAAAAFDADYLALSFPRSAADVKEARELFRQAGGKGGIVAKIERTEAIDKLEEIIEASDAVMIARGDLGVEMGDAVLPAIQKHIITLARKMNRVVITATQMMESMIHSQIPTRAEVFDVANAVFDGTDAVMLSAETAAGEYPDKAILAMDRICREAEKQKVATKSDHRINTKFKRTDEAIAMATMYVANHADVKAIASLTESGSTPLWMSRISSSIPIYALTHHVETRRKVTLYRGVHPINFEKPNTDHALVNYEALKVLRERGVVEDGDLVLLTKGDLMGKLGGTNVMKIIRVGDVVTPQK